MLSLSLLLLFYLFLGTYGLHSKSISVHLSLCVRLSVPLSLCLRLSVSLCLCLSVFLSPSSSSCSGFSPFISTVFFVLFSSSSSSITCFSHNLNIKGLITPREKGGGFMPHSHVLGQRCGARALRFCTAQRTTYCTCHEDFGDWSVAAIFRFKLYFGVSVSLGILFCFLPIGYCHNCSILTAVLLPAVGQ